MILLFKWLRDSLPWFSLLKATVTQAGEKLTFLFPRHHHPTLVELHGVRCDAHSCTVAATGGVLVPATGAAEEEKRRAERRSAGCQRALDTPRKRALILEGDAQPSPPSHPSKRWHLWIDQRQRVSYPLYTIRAVSLMWRIQCGLRRQSEAAHHNHVSAAAPEHSLVLKRVNPTKHNKITALCLFSAFSVFAVTTADAYISLKEMRVQHQHHHASTSAPRSRKAVTKSSPHLSVGGSLSELLLSLHMSIQVSHEEWRQKNQHNLLKS